MQILVNIDNLQAVEIGRVGNQQVDSVVIDCSAWRRKYPALKRYEVFVTNPEGLIYCPVAEMGSDGKLVWRITGGDTAIPGEGKYQVIATSGIGDRRASRFAQLFVRANMPGMDCEAAPDPSRPWVDKVIRAAMDAEEAAADAQEHASASVNPPIIGENGNWWLWDFETGAYADSGKPTRGTAPLAPVQSVNGKTGKVILSAEDIGALPGDTVIPPAYDLPTASEAVKGGVKVGNGLEMDGETLNAEVTKKDVDALSDEISSKNIVKSGSFKAEDFEKGSINSTGGNSDYYGQARIRNLRPVCYPYDILITPHDRAYNIVIYDDAGNYLRTKHAAWVYSRSYVPAGTKFRLLACVGEYDQTTRSVEEILDGLEMRPVFAEYVPDRLPDERSFEKGSLSSGNDSSYMGHCRIRSADIMSFTYDLKITVLKDGYGFYVCFYDENGTYLSGRDSGWRYDTCTIPAGKRFRMFMTFFVNGSEPSNVRLNIEDVLAGFAFEKSDVIERNVRAAEAIYASKKYFDMTHTGLENKGNTGLFTLAHITDLHTDWRRFDNFQRFCKKYSDRIDAAICTGDMVDDPTPEEFTAIMSPQSSFPVMYAVGNHDRSGANTTISIDSLKNYLNMDSLYYSVPYASQKIRLIVFDQYAGNTVGALKYTDTEMQWLCSELDSAQSAGQAVVIAFHQPECMPESNDKGFYQPYIPIEVDTYYDGTPIEDAVAAFKAGGSVSKSYTNSDGSVLTVNHNFAAAGKFMAYVCGHMHNDIVGYSSAHPDQLYLSITAGAIRSDSDDESVNFGNSRCDLPRVIGTQSEDAFCVYGFDTVNMLVKVVRVGSCVTSHMRDRLMAVYEV